MKTEYIKINKDNNLEKIIPFWLYETCYYLRRNTLINDIKKCFNDKDCIYLVLPWRKGFKLAGYIITDINKNYILRKARINYKHDAYLKQVIKDEGIIWNIE